jgi:D-xylono/L-arabinono-1,4-lactonase
MIELDLNGVEPELIVDEKCKTGEGPLWHTDEGVLYWVDIPEGKIFRYDPRTGKHEIVYHDRQVGGITIQEDGSLLLFMDKGAVAVLKKDGTLEYVIESLENELESRFNDVIADPAGRVFCGTMSTADHPGSLYRLDPDGSIRVVIEGTKTANGMGFTGDKKRMYFDDSGTRDISVFDYDEGTGEISNRKTFLEPPPPEDGSPDGMTVDSEDFVWSARWDGWILARIAPDGSEDTRFTFPAKKISCVTFGGDDLTDIYVTSAGGHDRKENGPGAGALYRLNLGIAGRPEFRSKIG